MFFMYPCEMEIPGWHVFISLENYHHFVGNPNNQRNPRVFACSIYSFNHGDDLTIRTRRKSTGFANFRSFFHARLEKLQRSRARGFFGRVAQVVLVSPWGAQVVPKNVGFQQWTSEDASFSWEIRGITVCFWLLVWNMNFIVLFHIWNIGMSSDFHSIIFQDGYTLHHQPGLIILIII